MDHSCDGNSWKPWKQVLVVFLNVSKQLFSRYEPNKVDRPWTMVILLPAMDHGLWSIDLNIIHQNLLCFAQAINA